MLVALSLVGSSHGGLFLPQTGWLLCLLTHRLYTTENIIVVFELCQIYDTLAAE